MRAAHGNQFNRMSNFISDRMLMSLPGGGSLYHLCVHPFPLSLVNPQLHASWRKIDLPNFASNRTSFAVSRVSEQEPTDVVARLQECGVPLTECICDFRDDHLLFSGFP